MSVRDTLVRNTLWYGLVTIAGLVSGLVMSVVLARGLGPARMGEYSYLLWAGRTLTAIAMLGFAAATVRYTASSLGKGDPALAWAYVELMRRRQLVATVIVCGIAVPLVLVVAPPMLRWPLVIIAVALFPVTREYIYSHSVYGAERYEYTAQASTVKMVLQLGAAVVLLSLGFDLLGLVVANALTAVVSCAIQRMRARQIYPMRPATIPAAALRELQGYLVPLSVVVVLDTLVWDRSEVFFLRLSGSPHDVAFYSLAFGLATKAMVLPEVTVGALLPALSALHGRGADREFRDVYRAALRYVTVAAVAVAALGVAGAPAIVHVLYGDAYRPVASLFSALVVVTVFASMRQVAWAALNALGDRRCAVTATSVAAIVNISAAAVLIPRIGVWGAFAANTAAQTVAITTGFVVMYRVYGCRFPFADVARTAMAGAIALATTLAVLDGQQAVGRLLLAAVAGLAVYVLGCAALRVLGRGEWQATVRSVRRTLGRGTMPVSPVVSDDRTVAPTAKPAGEAIGVGPAAARPTAMEP